MAQVPVPQSTTSFDAATSTLQMNIDGNIVDDLNQLPPLPEHLPPQNATYEHCNPPVAPQYLNEHSLFVAGSIEMGKAIAWQRHMCDFMKHLPITIANPRRGYWDPKAKPLPDDDGFRKQVQWELEALTNATVICFFFDVKTLSPVTMMELGLWARSKKIIVCCGNGFWRRGNVHITCERYGVPCVNDFSEMLYEVKKMLREKGMTAITDEEIEHDRIWSEGIVAEKAKLAKQAEKELEEQKQAATAEPSTK